MNRSGRDGNASIVFALMLIFSLASADPASAGLVISNPIVRLDIAPGQHINETVNLYLGKDDHILNLTAKLYGFGQGLDGANRELNIIEDISPYSARPFLKLSPANISIGPGQTRTAVLEGDVPKGVGAGGRYAIISFASQAMGSGSLLGVAFAIEVPILITISDTEIKRTGEITDLKMDGPISAKQQNVSVVLKNTGNYHFKAFASVALVDEGGDIVTSATTPLSFSSIIPTTSRLFEISLKPERELSPGKYIIKTKMDLEDGAVLASREATFVIKP